MIRINKLYDQFNSTYNTNQLGFFRPVVDFVPAVHEVSLEIFHRLIPHATVQQKYQDWLAPFIQTANLLVEKTTTMDFAPLPPDYEAYTSSRIRIEGERSCCENDCPMVTVKDDECIPFDDIAEDFIQKTDTVTENEVVLKPANKRSAITSHRTKCPTHTRPYIFPARYVDKVKNVERAGYEVLPKGIGVIVLDYYRLPKEPKYNYDVVQQGPDEYLRFVEAGSVHLEWSETLMPIFLYLLGRRYGLTIHDQLIVQVRQLDKLFE